MRIIVNRSSLADLLAVAVTVAPSRTPKPVLQCVKLAAGADGRLTASATDLEVGVVLSTAQVQVERPGSVLVECGKLRDITNAIAGDTVTLEVKEGSDQLIITGQDCHFKLYTQRVDEFPPVGPAADGKLVATISDPALRQLIDRTDYAAAKESTRYAFNGVLVVGNGTRLLAVATDGRRLAKAGAAAQLEKGSKSKSIVPAKALGILTKLLEGDAEQTVEIRAAENSISFTVGDAVLVSNLVEGAFPPYEDVIPKDPDKKATMAREDFLGALRRAALMASEESKGVRFEFSKKGIVMSSRSPEAGEATVNFPCKYDGADLAIGFNPAYMADALKAVEDDTITLEMTVANRPGLLKAGEDFLYVIMPVNLQ
jgi:DNA polymerase-3 subunit beta